MSAPSRGRAATAAGLVVLAAGALAAFTPAVEWLDARLAERATGDGRADAIVVLGAGLDPDGELGDHSLRRAVHGIRLFRRGAAPLILMLGPAAPSGPSEAEVRALLAAELGVPPGAIVVDDAPRTTREEAARARERLAPAGVRRVALVTGAHHMPRARRAFAAAGLDVVPAPAAERSGRPQRPGDRLALAWVLLQEAGARAYYRAAGAF